MERVGLKSDCILVLTFSSPRNSSFTLACLHSGFGFWLLGSPWTSSPRTDSMDITGVHERIISTNGSGKVTKVRIVRDLVAMDEMDTGYTF